MVHRGLATTKYLRRVLQASALVIWVVTDCIFANYIHTRYTRNKIVPVSIYSQNVDIYLLNGNYKRIEIILRNVMFVNQDKDKLQKKHIIPVFNYLIMHLYFDCGCKSCCEH